MSVTRPGKMELDNLFVTTMKPAEYGSFFINPFWGLVATNDRATAEDFGRSMTGPSYLYKIRVKFLAPLVVLNDYLDLKNMMETGLGGKLDPIELEVLKGMEEAGDRRTPGLRKRLLAQLHDGMLMKTKRLKTAPFEAYVFDTDQIEIMEGPTQLSGLRSSWPRWR